MNRPKYAIIKLQLIQKPTYRVSALPQRGLSAACVWFRPRPYVSGYFLIRYFFSPVLALNRPHVSGESGIRIRNFLNPLSRMEISEYAMNPEWCGR